MNRLPTPLIIIPLGLILLGAIFFFLRSAAFLTNAPLLEATIPAQSNEVQTQAQQTETIDEGHVVQAGETLGEIAAQYGVTLDALVTFNTIQDPNVITPGTRLFIPGQVQAREVSVQAPIAAVGARQSNQLIPDSELVFGPSMQGATIDSLVPAESYLRTFSENVEGTRLNGMQIVELVAERTRVNPRLLLAALEYKAGWVTQSRPTPTDLPMSSSGGIGLYPQLEWAANAMNLGYYGRAEAGISQMQLADGTPVAFDPSINLGTAGVHMWLGAQPGISYAEWQQAASDEGFITTYKALFGDPYSYDTGAFWTGSEVQPELGLPWETGRTWHMTGGPHGGWISGSAWAALDFVPDGDEFGCYESEDWVVAMADGVVARSGFGALVLDLDGDGYAGTGWSILYQHIATRERAEVGTRVQRGDRLGHPSCEGGYSTGTHLHLARLYNGRWVSADSTTHPFVLGGWTTQGDGSEYNGRLVKDGVSISAEAARIDGNAITNQ